MHALTQWICKLSPRHDDIVDIWLNISFWLIDDNFSEGFHGQYDQFGKQCRVCFAPGEELVKLVSGTLEDWIACKTEQISYKKALLRVEKP